MRAFPRTRGLPRPIRAAAAVAAACVLLPAAARALEVGSALPPGAQQTAIASERNTTLALPADVWDGTRVALVDAEGRVSSRAWRVPGDRLTTLDIMAPLRRLLEAEGYDVVLDCQAAACGGFDFRFVLPTLPEPDMHVDLGDFRWLTAERTGSDGRELAGVLVSRSSAAAYVQVTTLSPAAPADPGAAQPPAVPAGPAGDQGADPGADPGTEAADPGAGPAAIGATLEAEGRAVLDDLVFAPGSAELGPGSFASLAALAAYLTAHPGARVTLVGHTDTDGTLAANVALSRRRAESVAARLAGDYGIDAARIGAEGVGYLAPRASNLTPEGRALNRRVEVVLTQPG